MIFNSGGKYSLFEQDFNEKIRPLLIKLNKKEALLRELIVDAVSSRKTNSAYWNRLRREIKVIYSEMSTIFNSWAKENIPSRYRISIRQIQHKISQSSIIDKPLKGVVKLINSNASKNIMKFLYMDASETYLSALGIGRSNTLRLTRLTQQILLSETVINQTIADTFLQTGNLREATRALSGELWGKLYESVKEERFVQAGRYKYKPSYYAEMVGRVKFHEAHSYATLAQAKNYDTDLVQISSHNTNTAICLDFEGKVFSISGKDSRFPILQEVPPFHPNCLHLQYPTFESAMETQGTLDDFSEFSKGNISVPPIPANFIPVSKRKVV